MSFLKDGEFPMKIILWNKLRCCNRNNVISNVGVAYGGSFHLSRLKKDEAKKWGENRKKLRFEKLIEGGVTSWSTMLPRTVNYSNYQRERERRFPWKRALRSSKRRGEIGRRSLETMRGWTNGNHLSLRSSFLFLRSSTMQTWTLHGEILKKRKRKKKGGRIFELVERIIVLIFAILFFVEKFGI